MNPSEDPLITTRLAASVTIPLIARVWAEKAILYITAVRYNQTIIRISQICFWYAYFSEYVSYRLRIKCRFCNDSEIDTLIILSANISTQNISGNYVPRFRYIFHLRNLYWLVVNYYQYYSVYHKGIFLGAESLSNSQDVK